MEREYSILANTAYSPGRRTCEMDRPGRAMQYPPSATKTGDGYVTFLSVGLKYLTKPSLNPGRVGTDFWVHRKTGIKGAKGLLVPTLPRFNPPA